MSIADLYNIKRAIQRDEEWRPQSDHLTPSGGDDDSPSRTICIFCNKVRSQYACPTCQAPYCSLVCFRSATHADCALAFTRSTVREAVRGDGDDDEKKEEGRKVIMGILGRTAGLSIGGEMGEEEQEDKEEKEKEEVGEEVDDVVPDELDVLQARDFLTAWTPLLQTHVSASRQDGGKSTSDALLYNIIAVIAAHTLITNDLDIPHFQSLLDDGEGEEGTEERQPPAASISTVTPATSIPSGRPRKLLIPVIRSLFSDLVPFLTTSPPPRKKAVDSSKSEASAGTIKVSAAQQEKVYEVVLQDGEDLVLWLLSRMQPLAEHTEIKTTTLLCRILTRTANILEEAKVVSENEEVEPVLPPDLLPHLTPTLQRRSHALGTLADIYALFVDDLPTRRKILFYAAVLLGLSGERVGQAVGEVRAEVGGLEREEEVERERAGLGAWEAGREGNNAAAGVVDKLM
ncbi:hypothetical protein A4X06_0g5364 [Tilletia controversa]|uniref:HIT-type domain-containing protein n=2 Tax=Tilletia TaxID=13289 RepID=A0A8X7MQL9_9BASI|nr:hypothetical protein CF328_g4575 [Tilletia controversa]KAE8197966.1 hypothetical protein CF336_g1919 [Tilletia laevis]KAE8199335.1 hypothetical protein CF335_g4196 [Tilletia laevis]KAE8245865.1 hypothetical protein A4X06_0g5364 [Tilletia controversa]KAE8260347.1 hypothetical protein A4X03_0g3843 [Tilletia caries]